MSTSTKVLPEQISSFETPLIMQVGEIKSYSMMYFIAFSHLNRLMGCWLWAQLQQLLRLVLADEAVVGSRCCLQSCCLISAVLCRSNSCYLNLQLVLIKVLPKHPREVRNMWVQLNQQNNHCAQTCTTCLCLQLIHDQSSHSFCHALTIIQQKQSTVVGISIRANLFRNLMLKHIFY